MHGSGPEAGGDIRVMPVHPQALGPAEPGPEGYDMVREKLRKLLIAAGALAVISATSAWAAGWTTNTSGEPVYMQDNGTVAANAWIKAESNGQVIWYYASSNGTLKKGGWQTVGGYRYYFDEMGVMQTGWVDGNSYYCNPNTGAAVSGWQYLTIPEEDRSFYEDDANYSTNHAAWYFFATGTNKKYASDNYNVTVKTINGLKYGFDENGVMQLGWSKVQDTTPEISGYMYFAMKTDDHFKQGQLIENTWYTTTGPQNSDGSYDESLASGDVEYFYFRSNGRPAAGTTGNFLVQSIGGKKYLFNEKGNPVYGMQKGSTTTDASVHYYYCGSSRADCSVKTGRFVMTEADGDKITYYAESNGRGYTGVKNGYLYYEGRLQQADQSAKYQTCYVDGKNYVISYSGLVMKSKTNLRDADGNKVSTNADGTLKANLDGSLEALTPVAPDVDDID